MSQFLNFQSFAKPVVNQSTGKLVDTAMEDLPVRSVENVPDKVEIVCGDKSYLLPVDKLAAKSQFFARAFQVPMAEKMWRKVVLKDFDEKVFEKVVKYIVEDLFLFDTGVSILTSYGEKPHYVKLPIFSEFMKNSTKFMKNSVLAKWTQNLH